ncbi:FdrA family protein, partial [Candidatus Calescamantes bacterium]|nr:FdrA family protein [Candidatus Calescamantes bacterium]
MKFSKALKKLENINDAQLIMGTDANKKFLIQMGLKDAKIADAAPLDLIIYMESESDLSEEDIILMVEEVMSKTASTTSSLYEPSSIDGALKTYRDMNLALISVPGQYAAWEALNALRNDLHVMIFSDNVSLEDEIRLKTLGKEKELLVMGPDCGTSIINNIPLGFANRTNKGGVGLVSASGTGLQAVTAMVHNLGGGISQAIGTGGRDLSKEVGGITMLMGLDALMADESTKIIVL